MSHLANSKGVCSLSFFVIILAPVPFFAGLTTYSTKSNEIGIGGNSL
jgi:hypothetical protein